MVTQKKMKKKVHVGQKVQPRIQYLHKNMGFRSAASLELAQGRLAIVFSKDFPWSTQQFFEEPFHFPSQF